MIRWRRLQLDLNHLTEDGWLSAVDVGSQRGSHRTRIDSAGARRRVRCLRRGGEQPSDSDSMSSVHGPRDRWVKPE